MHVVKPPFCKVTVKMEKKVSDEINLISYVPSQQRALKFFQVFKQREKEIPSAIKTLENSAESCLTFFSFPQEEWTCLRGG